MKKNINPWVATALILLVIALACLHWQTKKIVSHKPEITPSPEIWHEGPMKIEIPEPPAALLTEKVKSQTNGAYIWRRNYCLSLDITPLYDLMLGRGGKRRDVRTSSSEVPVSITYSVLNANGEEVKKEGTSNSAIGAMNIGSDQSYFYFPRGLMSKIYVVISYLPPEPDRHYKIRLTNISGKIRDAHGELLSFSEALYPKEMFTTPLK